MALSILDGNQSATTLSTILTSGQHITAHTVVSLGTQAITDMRGAVSGSVVSISNFPATQPISIASVTIGSLPAISGTVTANSNLTANALFDLVEPVRAGVFAWADGELQGLISNSTPIISGTVTIGSALPAGTNRIGVVTIGAGTVTIGAGTAQIGSVTVGNSVTISSLPAISGTVTANVQPQQSDDTDPNIKFIPIGYATVDGGGQIDQWTAVDQLSPLPVYFPANNPIPAGTNRIGVVTIGAGTVTLGASTAQIGSVTASISGTVPVSISSVTVGNSVTIGSLPAISGTVTANLNYVEGGFFGAYDSGSGTSINQNLVAVRGIDAALWLQDGGGNVPAYLSDPIPAGTNRIGVVTIGGGTVTIGAGTAQIGSVTASISGTVPVSISSVTVGNSVTIGSLPAISGTVTAVNHQGTSVTTSNFTSTTASTTLASANASREVLTIFNEGAGNLHICAGATCTTIAYQVRLSAGDYYEVPLNQTSLTHSAVFATAGTARVTQIS